MSYLIVYFGEWLKFLGIYHYDFGILSTFTIILFVYNFYHFIRMWLFNFIIISKVLRFIIGFLLLCCLFLLHLSLFLTLSYGCIHNWIFFIATLRLKINAINFNSFFDSFFFNSFIFSFYYLMIRLGFYNLIILFLYFRNLNTLSLSLFLYIKLLFCLNIGLT